MGAKLIGALVNVIAKNPGLLESLVESGLQWAVAEMKKAAEKAHGGGQ